VVPLALGAVALTCGSAAAAVELFRDVSGDRYAIEILKDEIAKLDERGRNAASSLKNA
jgi:hypothetical protein